MFFSVDFELLGEIKPHDLKPGGADIQVFVLIHPKLLSFLSLFSLYLNPYHLPHPSWSFIFFIFVFPLSELLSSSSSILNFYLCFPFIRTFIIFLIHPELLLFYDFMFIHSELQSSFLYFYFFLILNLSKFTFTFSLSLSKTLKLLYRWLRRTRRSTWAWSPSGGWPGKQCCTELFWYLGAWVLGTCYLVLGTWAWSPSGGWQGR